MMDSLPAELNFHIDALPAHRVVQIDVVMEEGALSGARFRAATEEGTAWPWTRVFPMVEFPVVLKWAYLTVGDEIPVFEGPPIGMRRRRRWLWRS